MLWLVFHNHNKIIYIFVGKGQKQIEFGTSCSSLKKAGIFISGFYNIKSKETEKQQVVFCDMESGNYEDVEQTEESTLNNAPIGSILAWVPNALPGSNSSEATLDIPLGWQKCDGSIIDSPSVLAGQRTPDLNNEKRFLRGSPDETLLTLEDDMIQDHKHDISDPGHTHDYTDTYVDSTGTSSWNGIGGNAKWFPPTHEKTTQSQMTGVKVESVSSSYNRGEETRPKNMHVSYIMRIF